MGCRVPSVRCLPGGAQRGWGGPADVEGKRPHAYPLTGRRPSRFRTRSVSRPPSPAAVSGLRRRSACGPLLSLNFCFAGSGAATRHPGRARRLGSAVFAALRLPCAARVRGPVAQLPPFASLTVVEQSRRVSSRSALRARAPAPVLLGASHARRARPAHRLARADASTTKRSLANGPIGPQAGSGRPVAFHASWVTRSEMDH